jgi:hypothetical protein
MDQNNTIKQKIVISFGEDEYLPLLVSVGHNLKPENTYTSIGNLIVNTKDYYVIHKRVTKGENVMDMILTHSENGFIRGFLYYDNKEFAISDHRTYVSLQIGEFCYDNISVIRMSENPNFN